MSMCLISYGLVCETLYRTRLGAVHLELPGSAFFNIITYFVLLDLTTDGASIKIQIDGDESYGIIDEGSASPLPKASNTYAAKKTLAQGKYTLKHLHNL